MDLYSVLGVSNRGKAPKWYEVFFGRSADEIIGEEYLWKIGENAWVVVDDRDVRAEQLGGAMITLGVSDLDDFLTRLAANGIAHEQPETYSNGVGHVVVLDPDGNSLSLAEAPARRSHRAHAQDPLPHDDQVIAGYAMQVQEFRLRFVVWDTTRTTCPASVRFGAMVAVSC